LRAANARAAGAALLAAGILALALNLRAAITGLPPLFPELQQVRHLSVAATSLLAAVPVLCFGVCSPAAAPLSRAFGEERVLGGAAAALTAGLLARAALPGPLLFPGTIVACGAIALMNVLLPSLIKRRRPDRAGLLIGMYLLALAAGAVLASLVAVPLFTATGGGQWAVRVALGLWALPALAGLAVWLPQLRYRTLPAATVRPQGVLAMRRHALAWQVTAFMGLQSLGYYAALSWLPTLFRDRGVSAAGAGYLLALMNLGNAGGALALPVLAHRARDQRALVALAALVTAAGLAGSAFGPLGAAAPLMFLLGLGQGATLGLAIFFTIARAADPAVSASLSAFAQGGGYLVASTGPLFIGLLHSATGGWTVPVWVLLGVVALALASGWPAARALTVPGLAGPEGLTGVGPARD
jgi:CP family cyanate transporter-like MFS transporter